MEPATAVFAHETWPNPVPVRVTTGPDAQAPLPLSFTVTTTDPRYVNIQIPAVLVTVWASITSNISSAVLGKADGSSGKSAPIVSSFQFTLSATPTANVVLIADIPPEVSLLSVDQTSDPLTIPAG